MTASEIALPAGTMIEADPSTVTRAGGRVLMGGAPFRLLRLSSGGASLVQRWFAGEPVDENEGAQRLARRLVANGMAHPRPQPPRPSVLSEVTVVIPVKDDEAGLLRTLETLGIAGLPAEGRPDVIVVDDGSRRPVEVAGVRMLRSERPTGPGAARQRGLDAASRRLVAFIDAGVTLDADGLATLVTSFDDPALVAVAPRVMSVPRDDLVGRAEQTRSPLDLGAVGGPVGRGRPLSYVPTAALVARADAVRAAGGFDPDLRYGEDVDLVWRLEDHGQLRYEPSVRAAHDARADLVGLIAQRYHYGTAAGPLAARHGSAVAPVHASGWSVAVLALLASRRPAAATLVAAVSAWRLGAKLDGSVPDPYAEAAVLTAQGHRTALTSLVGAALRPWWPVLVLAHLTPLAPVARRLAATALIIAALGTEGSMRTRAETLVVDLIGDGAYSAGVWRGSLKARSASALLPHLMSWPNDRT